MNCLDLLTELNCSDENPHNLACFEAARLSMEPESVRSRASYRSEAAGAVAASGGLRGFELILGIVWTSGVQVVSRSWKSE